MPRVIYQAQADRDIRAHIEYLRDRSEFDRIRRFEEDLRALERILAGFPEAGRALTQGAGKTLRRIRLRRLPLFVWYMWEPDRDELTLVRVFHVKQLTPTPRLP